MRFFVSVLMFVTLMLATPRHAQAQLFPWFNGAGFSIGGGPMRVQDDQSDLRGSLIRPQNDRAGAVAVGAFLALGTRR